jgi:PKD repeat protein
MVHARLAGCLQGAWRLLEEDLRLDRRHDARKNPGARAVLIAACCCLCYLVAVSSASATPRLAFKGTRYSEVSHACPTPKPHSATCLALVRIPVSSAAAGEAGVIPYTAGDGALESGPVGGLTPAELTSAYGFEPTAGGVGQTLAIVDAYDDPSIESDLASFDEQYGIAACTKANGCFTKVSQTGSTTTLPEADTSGWSVEISLDVEVAHSTCPKCKILLVEAKTPSFKNLATAVAEAITMKATEISNSYGGPESELGTTEKSAYDHPGTVIAAATGDSGYYDWTALNEGKEPPELPNMPASLPSVVAVGGTTLELDEAGGRASETVWNGNGRFDESEYIEGATGGGCSTLFSAQRWQLDTPGFADTGCKGKRLAADVAAVADPNTGFDIYDSYNCGEECEDFKRGGDWLTIGGTSLSTPLVSALYALAGGSHGVSYPALTLYGHLGDSTALYDVTEGGDGFCDDNGFACEADAVFGADVDCEGTTACNAAPGYDGPSGVGTPNSLSLFEPLLPTAAIAPPNAAKVGVAASFSGAVSSDPYPGGSITNYSWSWGDGTPASSGVMPTHTYAVPGEYTLTLTVTDGYGLTSAPVVQQVDVVERTRQELEEEANATKHAEEELAAKKRAEEELAAKQKAEEQAIAKKAEAEATEKKAEEKLIEVEHEEAVARAKHEAERQAEAIAIKKHEEEAAKAVASQGVSGFKTSLVPVVPDAQLASTSLQVNAAGLLTLRISCPDGESSCVGSVSLRTLSAVSASRRQDPAKPSVLTLAAGSFSVPGGEVRTVTLHLSEQARALLARSRTLRARVTLLAHDSAGAGHTTQTLVTLRAPTVRRRDG